MAGLLSMAAAGTVAVAMWRPAGPSPRRHVATDGSALVDTGHGRGHRHRHCPHAARPLALLLVQVRSADLDLAHYIDADRAGGFPGRVMAFADDSGVRTPHIDVAGDPRSWRWLGVSMDAREAEALAYRLRMLPAIADARVASVVD